MTKQTGAEGKQVNTVYVEGGCDIANELYLSLLLDRSNHRVMFMASSKGGTNIEDVAEETPEAIVRVTVDPAIGMGAWQARDIASRIGLTGRSVRSAVAFFQSIYTCFMEMDCDMLEINPLVETSDGKLMALDCKMSFDSNALYRHPDVVAMRDLSEEDAAEVEAGEYNLSFVNLDGTIGCLVNGRCDGRWISSSTKVVTPANFLDVGGGAKAEVTAAFRIILGPQSELYSGEYFRWNRMKCDTIAEKGVIEAVKRLVQNVRFG